MAYLAATGSRGCATLDLPKRSVHHLQRFFNDVQSLAGVSSSLMISGGQTQSMLNRLKRVTTASTSSARQASPSPGWFR